MKYWILIYVCLANVALGQKVNISGITECRSTTNSFFGNRCEVFLTLSGDEVRKYPLVKISKIISATDDKGLSMLNADASAQRYQESAGVNEEMRIELLPASRKSTVIKELSGEITLFNPTEANGSIIKVKNFTKSANKNLVPKTQNFTLSYMTKESVQKMDKEMKAQKKAELEKEPKEVQEMAKAMMELIDAFQYMGSSPNDITFFITGDDSHLVKVNIETPSGKLIENNGSSSSGNIITYFFSEEIKPTYTLVLTVETASATKKIPFSFKNIDLP